MRVPHEYGSGVRVSNVEYPLADYAVELDVAQNAHPLAKVTVPELVNRHLRTAQRKKTGVAPWGHQPARRVSALRWRRGRGKGAR